MRIKLLESTRPYFFEGAGPAEKISLGFNVEFPDGTTQDYILGEVYFGPAMQDDHSEWYEKTKKVIEYLEKLTTENSKFSKE